MIRNELPDWINQLLKKVDDQIKLKTTKKEKLFGFDQLDEWEPKPLDLSEINRCIAYIENLELHNASIDFIKEILTIIFCGYNGKGCCYPSKQIIYRGVIWDKRPSNISQLNYCPPKYCTNFQRANRHGQSMFYGCFNDMLPFIELDIKPNQYIAFSEWQTKKEMVVFNIGYTKNSFTNLKAQRDVPKKESCEFDDFSIEHKIIGDFVAEQFTKVIPSGSEYQYIISAAIAEKYLSLGPFDGLVYPSIAAHANSDNIALLPNFVDSWLEFNACSWIKINKVIDGKTHMYIDSASKGIDDNGDILWYPH
jgi:hypothetical protein